MMRWFFLAILFVTTGCQLRVSSPTVIASATLPVQLPNTIRLVSIDFLPAELSKLEPHLRLSASMRVSVTQPQAIKYVLAIKTERWANGKLIPSHGSGWQAQTADGSGDVSCSFQQSEEKEGLVHFNQVIATQFDKSSSISTGKLELSYKKTATSLMGSKKQLKDYYDLPPNQEFAVWSQFWMTIEQANKLKHLFNDHSHEDLAKVSDWAIILKVKWKVWKPGDASTFE